MDTSPSTIFVNREEELKQITEAITVLQDEERLLRTPIIEFSGVQGIGKTTLLLQIRAIFVKNQLPCIMEDAIHMNTGSFAELAAREDDQPIALIIDALDELDSEQLQVVEAGLSNFLENTRAFVVLASRNKQKFERTRSLARKLIIHPLEPLERKYCIQYLDNFSERIDTSARDLIFSWTRGYPLAMEVMAHGILHEGSNPQTEQGQKQLLHTLQKKVIEDKLLGNVSTSSERTRLQTLLSFLSFPRRFNLILIQDLIEKFVAQYKLENSLAYITLPRTINEVTSVLYWNLERSGYCIDAPVRNLLLLRYRIEKPQLYVEVHQFLAEKNERFIDEVSGSDRTRYLREFLYHLALSGDSSQIQEALSRQVGRFIDTSIQEEPRFLQAVESFLQFYEEFQEDEELKEALGGHNTTFALTFLYRNLIAIYQRLPEQARGNWLTDFFLRLTRRSGANDFALLFEQGMRHIMEQITREDAIRLYHDLINETEVKSLLGAKFAEVDAHILGEFSKG